MVCDLVPGGADVPVEAGVHPEGPSIRAERDLLRVDVGVGEPVDEVRGLRAPVGEDHDPPALALYEVSGGADEHGVHREGDGDAGIGLEAEPGHDLDTVLPSA